MENVFGSLTLIVGVFMVFIALPSQIVKNYREKQCGLSFFMVFLSLCVYFFRFCYAITIESYYILIPDTPGVIFSAILMYQFMRYRKNT